MHPDHRSLRYHLWILAAALWLAWPGGPAAAHHETLGTSPGQAPAASAAATAVASSPEQQLLALINAERARFGLPPLRLDPTLSYLARLKSQDMVSLNYFGHYSPTYGYPYYMEYRAGIRARYMGAENIAAAGSVTMAHYLLMASPGHRRNILEPRFTDVGLGVVPGRWGLTVTQLFIGR